MPHTAHINYLFREIELMAKLRSPYVVNLLGASYVPGKMCVLTEFMDKGSVSHIQLSIILFNTFCDDIHAY